jgi:hypothetical protein
VQIIADIKTKIIYAANFCTGRRHDFRLFKESGIKLPPHVQISADSGYQGIADIHSDSIIPEKKTKMKPLTEKQKQSNRDLAKRRAVIDCIYSENSKYSKFYLIDTATGENVSVSVLLLSQLFTI